MAGRERQLLTRERRRQVSVKFIRYPEKFLDALGHTVAINDPDPRKQREALDAANNADPPKRFIPVQIEEASLKDVVCLFCDNIPYGVPPKKDETPLRASAESRSHARQCIDAVVQRPEGQAYVEYTDKSLEWLIKELQDNGDLALKGTLSDVVITYLQNELSHEEIGEIEKAREEQTQAGVTSIREAKARRAATSEGAGD
jgi:hypothetical protein